MSIFLETLKQRVLLCDGATGTFIQNETWDIEKDFLGHDNCSEILIETRPEFIAHIHESYFAVGSDCVETNTFGANGIVLGELGLSDKVKMLNVLAAEIARSVADKFTTFEQPRFVLGSIGPGTKLATLGHIDYDSIVEAYLPQVEGLLAGSVDALLLETHQDLLTIKAIVYAARSAMIAAQKTVPIFVQVTLEGMGVMLTGADLSAAIVSIGALGVDGIGLNCSLGPSEMAEHVTTLSQEWGGLISVMPNAGLPIIESGEMRYPLTPAEMAVWQKRFITKNGVNLIGGCCGTTPETIRALREMLSDLGNPAPLTRTVATEPTLSSLYNRIPLRDAADPGAICCVGERCNANGSKQFRELLLAENVEGAVSLATRQERAGAKVIDLCCAYTGRKEAEDVNRFLPAFRTALRAGLMIDSTDPAVVEAALKQYPGKAIINSFHFEGGDAAADKILSLAKQFGAAVLGLTIDETGMAKTCDRKCAIAKRLYEHAVVKHGIPAQDLWMDPLTFSICTGAETDKRLALETLDAIRVLSETYPDVTLVLGLSNVSFGIAPTARKILNRVFLSEAQNAGLRAAIIDSEKIVPLESIESKYREAATALLNDLSVEPDPLTTLLSLQSIALPKPETTKARTVSEQLTDSILSGDKTALPVLLDQAITEYAPVDIINTILLPAMQQAGEQFASGEFPLPFVLRSAETMKVAITYLEPMIAHNETVHKGTIVLATVIGDVHDIGKNLVDIILSNNGYRVINLGIQQPIGTILKAAIEYQADAIGLSGLLVKSTLIMKENLQILLDHNWQKTVVLGGAALTRRFVEHDCRSVYPNVHYAKDAFAGLEILRSAGM